MYYCLSCNKENPEDKSADKIFKSGYVLINNEKVPLGVCKQADELQSENNALQQPEK